MLDVLQNAPGLVHYAGHGSIIGNEETLVHYRGFPDENHSLCCTGPASLAPDGFLQIADVIIAPQETCP